jgi:hypothetical protein
MNRMGQIQHRIAKHHQQLVMLANKSASEGLILDFSDSAFPDPLPELRLRGPKLFPITTDHQRSLSLLLFSLERFGFVRFHFVNLSVG